MRVLAFDKVSVRTKDVDGRLHVAISHISKATVDPYYGHEIPDSERLGLDPDRVYYLLRHPDELEKAASTFNNLPILDKHVPVSAEAHLPELVIGSTGTDASFTHPFLDQSAVVWAAPAIKDIEDETRRAWSCGYYYRADMTSGVFEGLRFDGIMRDIVGNHVALVEEGRAGPEVVVGDSQLGTSKMLKSRVALLVNGALAAAIVPKLAQDAKISFSGALDGITAKNLKAKTPKLAAAIVALVAPKLAQDEGLDVEDVVAIVQAVQGEVTPDVVEDDDLNPDDPGMTADADGDMAAKIMAFLKGKISDEDMAALSDIVGGGETAEDDVPDDDGAAPPPATKAAMDKAIAKTRTDTLREMGAIRTAEREVRPLIGEVSVAMDSAAAVYKLALDHAEVDLTDVHPSAYRSLVSMLVKTASAETPSNRPALDSKAQTDFDKRFPNATKLVGA